MIIPMKVDIDRVEEPESFSLDREIAVGAPDPKFRVKVYALDVQKREVRAYQFESMRNIEAPTYRDVGSITVSRMTDEDEAYLRAMRDAINEELGETMDETKLAVYYEGGTVDRFWVAPAGLGMIEAKTQRVGKLYKTRRGAELARERRYVEIREAS